MFDTSGRRVTDMRRSEVAFNAHVSGQNKSPGCCRPARLTLRFRPRQPGDPFLSEDPWLCALPRARVKGYARFCLP